MFHFMRKDKDLEKEKKKKDKKDKKREKERVLTSEDLNRLDEVRRSYFGLKRKSTKEKDSPDNVISPTSISGPFAFVLPDDNSGGSLSPGGSIQNDLSSLHSDNSSEGSLNLLTRSLSDASGSHRNSSGGNRKPPLPVKPPKRSILKGKHHPSAAGTTDLTSASSLDDESRLVANTLANEIILYDASSNGGSNKNKNLAVNNVYQTPPMPPAPLVIGECLGESHSFSKTFNLDLKLPQLVPPRAPRARILTINRQPAGDFGFSLRRAIVEPGYSDGGERPKVVFFAEPGSILRINETGLLPGDRLLEVNAVPVSDKTREEIVDIIRASGPTVTLKVQPVPELSELTLRCGIDGVGDVELDEKNIRTGTLTRSASKRFCKITAKSDDQLAKERAWLDAERVWVVYKGGFAAARRLKNSPSLDNGNGVNNGRIKVQLEHNEEVIEVDDEDIEKANPPNFDRVEDLAQLRYLNESSILHTLRQRYGGSLVHTYAGSNLIVLNPMRTLAVYSEKVMQMFKGCKRDDMPPHVYATAQNAYRSMLASRSDQSIVFMGRSGSGKTTNCRHVLHYLSYVAGSVNKLLTLERLAAIHALLESFGNSRTVMNTNATRFVQLFSLDFDHAGLIANVSIQVLMLDKARIVKQPENEFSFNIFDDMLYGGGETFLKEYHLENVMDQNLFFNPLQRNEEKQKSVISWRRVLASLEHLGVSTEETKAIWCVLAAILHLGVAGAIRVANNKGQFVNPKNAQLAASLLGTNVEELTRAVFQGNSMSLQIRSSFRTSPNEKTNGEKTSDAMDCLEAFVIGLYCEAFSCVVSLVNRTLATNYRTMSSILVLDTPGFQNPASCGRHTGACFEDFCYNYVQERLQLLFHDHSLVAQQDKYAQERIDCNLDDLNSELISPSAVVNIIDKPSQQGLLRASNLDLRNLDQRGLLWLLDEEALTPNASDESFLEKFLIHNNDLDKSALVKKGALPGHMILQHYNETNPVVYNVLGWLRASRENPISRHAASLLQDSQKEGISKLFLSCRGAMSITMSGSVVGLDGTTSLRKASSIRRTYTMGTAGVKRKSICLQVKFQTDGIMETLRRTKLHFVHCLLPQHNGGLCELNTSLLMPTKTSSWEEILLNVPLLRSQVRGLQILEAVRMHKQGYPENMIFSEFIRRFEILASGESKPSGPQLDEKKAAEAIIGHLDIDRTQYKIGLSQIFFRSGALPILEEQRDNKLQGSIVSIQAYCRSYLTRKRVEKLKVQDLAIRCVQRNVRKLLAIRNWPWWRLWIRILPLLNVHRTEEELRSKTDELNFLRLKVEKLEKDRADYKHENDRLEAKVSELTADLSEEHATSTHASEMLEAETVERMRLQDIEVKYENLKRLYEKAEMEVMEVRMFRSSELNGDISDNEDDDIGSTIYRQKYESVLRDLEFTKKKLQQQYEDDMEHQYVAKKALDKKLYEAQEEADQQRQIVGQWKRKAQRIVAEMNDLRLLLDEQTARNETLEKKQRKFDLELNTVQEEVRQERFNKERIIRDKEIAVAEKFSIEQEMQTIKLELEMKEEKVKALNKELDELSYGGKGEEEVVQLKRTKHELEMKIKDQEEELDDLAGQVQMLEQAKLRLEMNLENFRKEYRKEVSQKEEEIEETRSSCQKKLKALEQQLENEHDERQALIKEKHDLERRFIDLQERPLVSHDAETIHRLRKDLKRTKALLRDAQLMLERSKDDGPMKSLIRQLKNQLEDAEFAKTVAIKARQGAELELQELQSQIEDMARHKADFEHRYAVLTREKNELQVQQEENEEEMAEIMRKYKAAVAQLSVDQLQLSEQASQISELEMERNSLKDQLTELHGKLEILSEDTTTSHEHRRLELKVKELESKMELELTTKTRLEVQVVRLKETVEKITEECESARSRERQALENSKKLQRHIRDIKEDYTTLEQKEMEVAQKRRELEMAIESLAAENQTLRSDLKLAMKRIEDLQMAMEDNAESEEEEEEGSIEGDSDSDSSDTSIESFLACHMQRPAVRSSRLSSSNSGDLRRVSSNNSIDSTSRDSTNADENKMQSRHVSQPITLNSEVNGGNESVA